MVTLDELIREGEAIRAEELIQGNKEFRNKLRERHLPLPVQDPAFVEPLQVDSNT